MVFINQKIGQWKFQELKLLKSFLMDFFSARLEKSDSLFLAGIQICLLLCPDDEQILSLGLILQFVFLSIYMVKKNYL